MRTILPAVALCIVSVTALAHHSTSHVDTSKKVDVKGILKGVEFINPHAQIHLEVRDVKGKTVNWTFEGPPPGWLRRAGIKQSEFKEGIGHEVTIRANPARDGSPFGLLEKVIFADGRSVGFSP